MWRRAAHCAYNGIWMSPRLFSRDEAERLIPRLTDLISRLQESKREYDKHEAVVAELTAKTHGNGHMIEGDLQSARAGLEQSAAEVNELVAQIQELGCELKGIEEGLVDFRTDMDGREVYLCWKLGEPAIDWWHDLETGFAGRRRLESE
jgi:hypothetical protein